MTPTVSIALATCNGERHLARQLQSIAWQTRLPNELIITDDCSTDGTVALVEDFAGHALFPVRIIINDHVINFRANFMKAVQVCTSDLIMFCDQDDIWRPDKIAVMTQVFADNPSLLFAYHHATIVDDNEHVMGEISDPIEQDTILKGNKPPPWHFARGLLQTFRRELTQFDDLWPQTREHFSDDPLGHDRWYMLLAMALGRAEFVNCDLLMYRQHGGNAFGADRELGYWARSAARLAHTAQGDAYSAAGARSRALALDAVATRVSQAKRIGPESLAEAYRIYAARLDRRRETFGGRSIVERGAAFIRSLVRGDYRGNPWGFDPRSIVRDGLVVISGRKMSS